MYLVDTNLVSELRRAKNAHPRVRAWSDGLPAESLYLSVISILELEIGILLLERRDRRQGAVLRAWMDGRVLPTFSDRILAVDTRVAQRCAALHVPEPRSDRDALIAAPITTHASGFFMNCPKKRSTPLLEGRRRRTSLVVGGGSQRSETREQVRGPEIQAAP